MFETQRDGIRDSLIANGFREVAEAIANQAKVGIDLYASAVAAETDIEIGASKLGGSPDLPHGAEWPSRPGYPESDSIVQMWLQSASEHRTRAKPDRYYKSLEQHRDQAIVDEELARKMLRPASLSFIGQFTLTELDPEGLVEGLPETGRLLLFYEAEHQPWGHNPYERAFFKVLYDDTPISRLDRRVVAENDLLTFEAHALSAKPTLCALPPDTYTAEELNRNGPGIVRYRNWWSDVFRPNWNDQMFHRLGGWPDVIQGDMQLPAEYTSHGLSMGGPEGYEEGAKLGLAPGALDWVLLLQVATEDDMNMMWGDAGTIYVWIRRQDLEARRFDRCYLELQCY